MAQKKKKENRGGGKSTRAAGKGAVIFEKNTMKWIKFSRAGQFGSGELQGEKGRKTQKKKRPRLSRECDGGGGPMKKEGREKKPRARRKQGGRPGSLVWVSCRITIQMFGSKQLKTAVGY